MDIQLNQKLDPNEKYRFWDKSRRPENFYSIDKTLSRQVFIQDSAVLYSSRLQLGADVVNHTLMSYTFLNLLGDIGGVFELIVFMAGIVVYPYERHCHSLSFISKMFLTYTNSKSLFPKKGLADAKHPNYYQIKFSTF